MVDDLLTGPALGRSDQLRQLLRYLAEEEAAGRGAELSEHTIGVNALGRPADYAPEVDSTVRSRIHELRKRLEDHYRRESGGEWRIEIPKGTYRLRFVQTERPASPDPKPREAEGSPARFGRGSQFGYGLAAGLLTAAVIWGTAHWWTPAADRAALRVWGPLLKKGEAVSVVLATAPQLWVREFGDLPLPAGDPAVLFAPPDSDSFRDWFARIAGRKPQRLLLHPNHHSPMGGEANAAISLAAFAAGHGVRVELLLGENTGATEIRDRNAVVLGRAEYSRAAAALQPAKGYAVRYVPERRAHGVVLPDSKGFFREEAGRINYGLVTMLSKRTTSGLRTTMLVSGINSDGSEAAMAYMTTPDQLEELEAELIRIHGRLPGNYQIVVRSRSSDTRSLLAERAAVLSLD